MLCTSGRTYDMFSYHGTNGQTGMVLCGSPCGGGLAGRLAGRVGGTLVMALAVRWLNLAADRDGGARFAMCSMLVVSCALGQSLSVSC